MSAMSFLSNRNYRFYLRISIRAILVSLKSDAVNFFLFDHTMLYRKTD
jgi:hypothetical protein